MADRSNTTLELNNEVGSVEGVRFRWVKIHAPVQHSKNGDGLARIIDAIKDEDG